MIDILYANKCLLGIRGDTRKETATKAGTTLAVAWLRGRQETIDLWGFDDFGEDFVNAFLSVVHAGGGFDEGIRTVKDINWLFNCETGNLDGPSCAQQYQGWLSSYLAAVEQKRI